ncbi:translation elongation factor Ts [Polyangium sp. 6x1]|uniref:translation elongation factor Ts n=1 Tax=Polyangium sp. 6x1 TaxID=3042689 RepID=UPI002482DFED|nr:translation elongation factor Ts [Polyangium sp. 6x1]MDI1449230.1 translation elongation factor Ts [Polyangium sp. 6x1]
MAGINPQAIKELRERTQAGMSDCKNALTEAEGDMEKAVEIILKKGLAKSAKRAGAVASEGEVRASVSTDKRAATLVEVNIQTDFSARSDEFKNFVGDVLCLAEAAPLGADLKNSELRGKKVGDVIVDLTARIGEKIDIRRWDRTEVPAGKSGLAHAYVHLGGKIGVVLALETENDALAQHAEVLKFADETAMQIAAMNPVALVREDISDDAKAKQKEIFEGQLREDPKPKPESAWPKIIEGKFNKWFSEVTLTEQESVVVPGQTIDKLRQAAEKAAGGSVKIVRFVRFERGEGIEKPQGPDFASEVAKMAGG